MSVKEANSLPLKFVFYDSSGAAYSVTDIAFVFTVSDWDLTQEELAVIDTDWVRDEPNQIAYTVTDFALPAGKYKVDFTGTLNDGTIRTFFDGEMEVVKRLIHA
jgi:hypothetical protein